MAALLGTIPHSLLLANSNGEQAVLVPAWPPCRPKVNEHAFSTELVLERTATPFGRDWASKLEHPYYIYPCHVSQSFLFSTTLASALYTLVLAYLARDYKRVVQLVDTVSADHKLSDEERNCLTFMGDATKVSADQHPDAHACRLRISLVMLDMKDGMPWDLSVEMAEYVAKLAHVSADCRLPEEDELSLLVHCVCDPADPRYDPNVHAIVKVYMCKNRRSELRARMAMQTEGGGKLECNVELPPRPAASRWMRLWNVGVLHTTDDELAELLEGLEMKHKSQRAVTMDGLQATLGSLNKKDQGAELKIEAGFCERSSYLTCMPSVTPTSQADLTLTDSLLHVVPQFSHCTTSSRAAPVRSQTLSMAWIAGSRLPHLP